MRAGTFRARGNAAQAIAAAGMPLIVLRDNAPDPVQALTDAMLAVAQAMARKP